MQSIRVKDVGTTWHWDSDLYTNIGFVDGIAPSHVYELLEPMTAEEFNKATSCNEASYISPVKYIAFDLRGTRAPSDNRFRKLYCYLYVGNSETGTDRMHIDGVPIIFAPDSIENWKDRALQKIRAEIVE